MTVQQPTIERDTQMQTPTVARTQQKVTDDKLQQEPVVVLPNSWGQLNIADSQTNPPSARKPITSTAPAVMPNTAGSKNLAGQLAACFIELVRSRFLPLN